MSILRSYFGHSPEDLFGDKTVVSWEQRAPFYDGKLVFDGTFIDDISLIEGLVTVERLPINPDGKIINPISIDYTLTSQTANGLIIFENQIETEPFSTVSISEQKRRRVINLTNLDGGIVDHNLGMMHSDNIYTLLALAVGERFQRDFSPPVPSS